MRLRVNISPYFKKDNTSNLGKLKIQWSHLNSYFVSVVIISNILKDQGTAMKN